MNQIELYRRMARILTRTASCPAHIAALHFNVEWRDEDTDKMGRLTGIVRCYKCLQWLEFHSICKAVAS